MRSLVFACFTSLLVFGGCAEAGVGTTTSGTGTSGNGGASTTAGSTGASTTGGASGSSSAASGGMGAVVINEISAKSEDWIELANAGTDNADLGGYGLCDSDAVGACSLTDAVRFPAGTRLAPGEYLLIVGNKSADAGVGPFTDCLATGGPSTCFYASWKVSSSKGEKVHFIGPNDAVVTEVEYPINAVVDGQTWGRLPDLTGAFGANKPTPGAANLAP